MKIFRLTAESTHYNNDVAIDIGFAIRRRWLLLLLLLLIGAAALWVIIEPPQSAEAKQWISEATDPEPESLVSYQYLLGINASADEEPVAYGERLVAAARNNEPHPASQPYLDLPSGELYCRIRQEGCLKNLLSNSVEISRQLSQNKLLLARTREFFAFESYQSPVGQAESAAARSYGYLLIGDKLAQFDIISNATSGRVSAATDMLTERIKKLRKSLAEVDSLSLKMLIVSLLVDNLDLAAGLYAQSLVKQIDTLAELTPQENSMVGPLRQEFVSHASVFQALATDFESVELNKPETGFAAFVSRITFSKNRAINAVYSEYRKLLVKASLPTIIIDEALAKATGRVDAVKKPLLDLDDVVGSALNAGERIDLAPFVFRLRDLDSKLKLLRIRMTTGSFVSEPYIESIHDSVDLSNPYNPGQTVMYDARQKSMCFDGPRPDYHGARCLSVY